MKSPVSRIVFTAQLAAVGIGLMFLSACASLTPEKVQEEPGYYYGWGTGNTTAEAEAEAKKDLITKALARSRERDGIRRRVDVTPEVVGSFKLPNLKVYAQDKSGGTASVVYRIKESDWDEYRANRQTAALAEVLPRIPAMAPDSGRPLADRLAEAASILDRLNREALADVLRVQGPDSPLVADAVENLFKEQSSGIRAEMDIRRGFVGEDTVFSGRFVDSDGRPLGAMPVRAVWTVRSGQTVADAIRSDADGAFVLKFPQDRAFHNHSVRLVVSSGFSDKAYGSSILAESDAGTRGEYCYQHFDDVEEYFSGEAMIPGGEYAVGSLERDKRATRREAPRKAVVEDFYMDTRLVTNALYDMFLGDTGATEFPEYWDNPEYNQDDQPVIGVSYEDAVRFAAWLSEQLGAVKRLPTEAEWEIAARGGRDVVYPWGDQSPDEGDFANYNGNGQYAGPSPVGAFEEGKNSYGLYDMAGNVWQWTSTPRDAGKPNGLMIVKGGSWMDGPADLRVSNRRDLDPRRGYADVGFRLVREITE